MFEVQTNLIFWTMVSFGILVLLLYKVALPPLLKLLEERRIFIQTSLQQAEEMRRKNEEALKEYKEKIRAAGLKAEEIISLTKKEARHLQEHLTEKAQKEAALMVEHAKEEIEHQKTKAVEELRSKTASLIVDATARIIGKKLVPEEDQTLIQNSIEDAEKNL